MPSPEIAQASAPADAVALNVDEAAQMTRLHRATIYKLIASGDLKSIKIGRRRLILRTQLQDLLQASAA